MANEQNLIPFSERTESEQREIRSKGGKASAAARREKKTFRELMEEYGGMPDENDPRLTNDQAIMINQYKLAKSNGPGSTKAAEFVRDTKGEAPKNAEFNITADVKSITINFGKGK